MDIYSSCALEGLRAENEGEDEMRNLERLPQLLTTVRVDKFSKQAGRQLSPWKCYH